jgi:hypothetical protein
VGLFRGGRGESEGKGKEEVNGCGIYRETERGVSGILFLDN